MTNATTHANSTPVTDDTQAARADQEVLAFRENFEGGPQSSPFDQLVREGARQMLQAAIDAEVATFVAAHSGKVDESGRRYVVRNGYLPERDIMTTAGQLPVQQPRVRDNSPDPESRVTFSPNVLPPYLKRTQQMEELILWLYLKGVSTGDFGEALQALVGES